MVWIPITDPAVITDDQTSLSMPRVIAQMSQKKSGLAQKSTKPRVWVSQEETLRVALQDIAEHGHRGLENYAGMEQIRHKASFNQVYHKKKARRIIPSSL
jgi:hypothetical protein